MPLDLESLSRTKHAKKAQPYNHNSFPFLSRNHNIPPFFKNIIYPNEEINVKKPKVRAFIREVEDDFKAKQSENPKPKVRQTVWVLIGGDYLSLKNPYGDVVLIDGEKTIKRSR